MLHGENKMVVKLHSYMGKVIEKWHFWESCSDIPLAMEKVIE
jgi:hypothetical protein